MVKPVMVLALSALLFVLSSGDWLSEPLSMMGTVFAAVLATVGLLLLCVRLTRLRGVNYDAFAKSN